MRLKPITGFTMLVLLFGVATAALQNSAFAQTSTNDLDGDYKKKIEKITKLKHEEKLKQVAKEKFAKEAKEKFTKESKEKLRTDLKNNFKQESKEKLKQGTKEQFVQQAKEKLRPEIARPVCNPSDSDLARKELATMEQRYSEMKMKFYNEWQPLNESGEYDGPWEKFAQEHFLNSPELADMKNVREIHSQFFRNCVDARETRPNLGLPNDIREVRPYTVSPNDVREVKPYTAFPTNTPRIACNEDDYLHAKKEIAALEQRYGDLKEKYYQEWQRLHESGEYDGSWEKFAEEKFLNSSEIADLNHKREKYHQLMMRCSNAQHGITEQDNYEEETTSDNDLTDELEDEIVLDNDVTDYLDEETILDDDLDELLTEIESISVPESIKDEAGWWADNQIEDSDFASSIEYLASQNVMQLAGPSGPDSHIPQWVKAIAAWWAEGKIPDKEFVNAVQFLVNHGIIKV